MPSQLQDFNEERGGVGRSAMPPGLYFVATPIGAADDITLRGLDILRRAEVLAAEDTRRTRKLLEIHGIGLNGRKIVPYHDHNGPAQRPRLLAALSEGQRVAYVSDAGTPLIADPGYRLAAEAIEAGAAVFAVPGASALLAALTVAGLPTDKFYFGGFLPPKKVARRKTLEALGMLEATLVFYESARRATDCLEDMAQIFGSDRPAAICRELTKRFEETRRGTLGSLLAELGKAADLKGECVVLVGPPVARDLSDAAILEALEPLLKSEGIREASTILAQDLGIPRRRVYGLALGLNKDRSDNEDSQ